MNSFSILISITLLAFSIIGSALAADSTESPVTNLSMSENFSASSGSKRLWTGHTTGRINLPNGYKIINVNGIKHFTGLGYVTYLSDGTCTLVITDSYTQGCATKPLKWIVGQN
ncbi:hypothetical protein L1D14_07685 [Vibrio tubiashii]|uniref:hypothetical protein n=1 Tax=Vibrio tubiashii TaxID=29498 RepID=UPI001EFD9633|nr:hypothetical protein [Vibrio tubiashii]MCG9576120.1 hypothetical protein [Vibrio tubiashii]